MTERGAFKIEIVDEEREPVRLYKDAACTVPHEGLGIIFVDRWPDRFRITTADGELQPEEKE